MSALARRREDLLTRFSGMDRLFEDWLRTFRPFGMQANWPERDFIRVDEYRDGDIQVIRADLPGIDPDKDVTITAADGMLYVDAERRVDKSTEDEGGYSRHELFYGRMSRTLPLAEGATEADITASYKDGILEIRVPARAKPAAPEPKKIAISRS